MLLSTGPVWSRMFPLLHSAILEGWSLPGSSSSLVARDRMGRALFELVHTMDMLGASGALRVAVPLSTSRVPPTPKKRMA